MPQEDQGAVARALRVAAGGELLDEALMMDAVRQMTAANPPLETAAELLQVLAKRGEQMSEIVAAARVLIERGLRVPVQDEGPLLDTCGTGGTGRSLFNCSTCAALVAAAAGVRVAKHGNRTGTRACGSADLLEEAGVALVLSPEAAARCLQEVGMVFLFAPAFHPAMKHVAPVRRALGIRTIFNLIGPLANPARTSHQVLGVPDLAYLRPMAEALARLGGERALVVRSRDGLDEISPAAPTDVVELCADGQLRQYSLNPRDFGVEVPLDRLTVASPAESLEVVRRVLGGEVHPAAEMVALNAGAALFVAGLRDSLQQAVQLARQTLAAGEGLELLQRLAAVSTSLAKEADQRA